MELTPEEGRVLGCLVEKQLTTPQHYPLTDNALIAACNQTTSRDPVVQYDLTTVRVAVRSLREKGLARTVHRSGERSDKHQHELPAALDLSPAQVAVLAVLLLRGPQTAAELRARTERMHAFGSPGEVEDVLTALAERDPPLAARLERQPGRREDRYAETLVGTSTVTPTHQVAPTTQATPTSSAAPSAGMPPPPPRSAVPEPPPCAPISGPVPAGTAPAGAGALGVDSLAAEVARLRADVDELRAEVAELRAH